MGMAAVKEYQTGTEVIEGALAVRRRLMALEPWKPLVFHAPPPASAPTPELDLDIEAQDLLPPESEITALPRKYSIRDVQKIVCRATQTRLADMLSRRRPASVVVPRQIAMALCARLLSRSLPEIGRHFGGKDHTTVLHAKRKFEPVMDVVETQLPPGSGPEAWTVAMLDIVVGLPREQLRGMCQYCRQTKERREKPAIAPEAA